MGARRRIGAVVVLGAAAAAATLWARRRLRAIADAPDPYTAADLAPLDGERSTVVGHDGIPISVVDAGQGPAIVLIHGLTATTRFWALTQRALVESGHRVVAFDQRGHGGTGVGDDGYGVEALGHDLAAVLEALDVTDAVVVGHSLGGVTLQSFLVHHHDDAASRLRHAVIACSLSHNRPEGPLLAMLPGADRMFRFETPTRVAALLTANLFGADAPPASLVDLARDIYAEHDAAMLGGIVRGMARFDLRPGLPGVTVPVTVVAAGRDRVTPPRYSHEIVALLPSSDEHWFPSAGHLLPWEMPDDFVAIVEALASDGSEPA